MSNNIDITKHLKKISFKDSGEAFWAALALLPNLDGLFDEKEDRVIMTQIPKYLGQLREVGVNDGHRPFPKLNEKDWPEIFSYVSSAWNKPTQDEDGSINLVEVDITIDEDGNVRGDRKEEKLKKLVNKQINNWKKLRLDLEKKCELKKTDTGTFILVGSEEAFSTYLECFVNEIHSHFIRQKERSELLLTAIMLLTLADGDSIGPEKLYVHKIFNKFKVGSYEFTEKFNNFIIPNVFIKI